MREGVRNLECLHRFQLSVVPRQHTATLRQVKVLGGEGIRPAVRDGATALVEGTVAGVNILHTLMFPAASYLEYSTEFQRTRMNFPRSVCKAAQTSRNSNTSNFRSPFS
jgi:hypothetical protein